MAIKIKKEILNILLQIYVVIFMYVCIYTYFNAVYISNIFKMLQYM
jgi:hypothetical protein